MGSNSAFLSPMTGARVNGTVYDPPTSDFPFIAVVFYGDEVLVSRAVPSRDAGEAFLTRMINDFAEVIAKDKK